MKRSRKFKFTAPTFDEASPEDLAEIAKTMGVSVKESERAPIWLKEPSSAPVQDTPPTSRRITIRRIVPQPMSESECQEIYGPTSVEEIKELRNHYECTPCSPPKPEIIDISVPEPVISVPVEPVIDQLLPSVIMNLPLNFHSEVTDLISKHVEALNQSPSSEVKILLVTGKTGTGKTFCVQRACENSGFEYTYIDMLSLDVDAQMRDTILARPDPYAYLADSTKSKPKNIRVAIIDAIDGYDKKSVDKLCKFISNIMNPGKATKGRKKERIRFRPNMIVFTATDRYEKTIVSWMYQLSVTEIKVTPIDASQTNQLMIRACEYLQFPMKDSVYRLISESTEDLTSMFMKLQFMGADEIAAATLASDERSVDIFTCCKHLLEPPENSTIDNYCNMWKRGGEKVTNTLYNSYTDYVPFCTPVPEIFNKRNPTANDRKLALEKYTESGGSAYYAKSLVASHQIANSFSDMDISLGNEMLELAQQMIVKLELEDIFIRATKQRRIDVKTRTDTVKAPNLGYCRIGVRESEILYYVALMRSMEMQKRVKNFEYQMDERYELSEFIGKYYTLLEGNRWLIMDLFSETDEQSTKDAKKKMLNPKLECIQIFSHPFEFSPAIIAAAKSKRKYK